MVALVLLVAIVITGAGVRLTGSGLGCTDWPACTDRSFTPTDDLNSKIEFYNRLITGLVGAAVIAAVLGSLIRTPRRRDLTSAYLSSANNTLTPKDIMPRWRGALEK